MMIQTVNTFDFHKTMEEYRPKYFSYDALTVLFNYLYTLGDDDKPYIFDPVAVCLEWSEYFSINDACNQYQGINDLDDLSDKTIVLVMDNGGA